MTPPDSEIPADYVVVIDRTVFRRASQSNVDIASGSSSSRFRSSQ